MIFDAAVIIPTVLRPVLRRAVRSVYAQDFKGSVQIMIGIDVAQGERGILDELRKECPKRMQLVVVDLGYSTSQRHDGFYPIWGGGALRTILSYAANSRYLAYLDDDNWWAPEHLSTLRAAIEGKDWAWSYRWYVDPDTQKPLCVDRWESVGPERGMYAQLHDYHGHVDTNCYLIDKRRCHWTLPAWCIPHPHKGKRPGGGEDRVMFRLLRAKFSGNCSGRPTAYYVINKEWRRVVRYLLAPANPGTAGNAKREAVRIFAARIARTGIQIESGLAPKKVRRKRKPPRRD